MQHCNALLSLINIRTYILFQETRFDLIKHVSAPTDQVSWTNCETAWLLINFSFGLILQNMLGVSQFINSLVSDQVRFH